MPPIRQLLAKEQRMYSARLCTLDAYHPLTPRAWDADTPRRNTINRIVETGRVQSTATRRLKPRRQNTRLRRTFNLMERVPCTDILPPGPPAPNLIHGLSKEDATAALLSSPLNTDVVVYSDGSKDTGDDAGFGYAVYRSDSLVTSGRGRLAKAEVFDAEIWGALTGLQAALRLTPPPQDVTVLLDNTAAIRSITGRASISSQAQALEFSRLAKEHGDVLVRWCPGHKGIDGNEFADFQAKLGCTEPTPTSQGPTAAFTKRWARQRTKEEFSSWWEERQPESYKRLNLPANLTPNDELNSPRPLLARLLAARSGHGDFADYHERFHHDNATLACSCGRRKSPKHLFYCRKVKARHRLRLAPPAERAIAAAIGKEFPTFVKLV